ncbi:MAG: nucleoside triphosphate pyrophosphohydrolase [Planctomycetota bacterium]|nr:nucleoside triphosphate pyrophosphohydrolase [Planctomycetota bacterium]
MVKKRTRPVELERLARVMRRLRGRGGCPWDRRQRLTDIGAYLLEESHETLEAIRAADFKMLLEELGDLLYQIVFIAYIAEEKGKFTISDVINGISDKLERRHPHVFGDARVRDANDVLRNWEGIKLREKSSAGRKSLLDGVPLSLPALLKAYRLGSKAAHVGFDWQDVSDVFGKLSEEIREFAEALEALRAGEKARVLALKRGSAAGKRRRSEPRGSVAFEAAVRDELGDILFVICNIARKLEIDPEDALQRTNAKFIKRFKYIERKLHKRGKSCADVPLDEMERLWQQAKR